MPESSENPCIACGACCAYYRVSFYCGELTGGSGGWVPVELTSMITPLMACMQGTESGNGRCVALSGELGKPGISCNIYENRPTPCREFAVWLEDGTPNPDCQSTRARIGLPALGPISPVPRETSADG